MAVPGAVDATRRRELAGAGRSSRFARDQMWERILRFVRMTWRPLLILLLAVPVALLPVAFTLPRTQAAFVVGFGLASAVWADVFVVLVLSGVIGSLGGLMAEASTADEFRRLRRQGWRLVNGIALRERSDIDHIAVGPPGVLVVETKYSEDAWPVGVRGGRYMERRLAEDIEQVRDNAGDVAGHTYFKRVIGSAPIRAVLVVDSAAPKLEGAHDWLDADGVVVVRSSQLRRWLDTLDGDALDQESRDRILAELSERAVREDGSYQKRSGAHRPTLMQIMWAVVGSIAGFTVVMQTTAILPRYLEGWAYLPVVPAYVGIGLLLRRVHGLRWIADGWLVGCAVVTAILVVVAAGVIM